jgi:RNA polymerase sigma-70 factor (ECF subfamily)
VSNKSSSGELATLMQTGRTDVSQELCVQLSARVARLVASKLGRDSEAKDVVQDAFEQILRSIPSLQNTAQLESWVTTVTTHTVSRELRRRRRKPCVLFNDFDDIAELSVEPDLDGIEALGRVARILDRLSGEQRRLVWLDRVERHTANELVLMTGLPMSTLKRRLRRARLHFGRLLAKDALLTTRRRARWSSGVTGAP